jgi:tripartite ATP-independent transporter DctM subunit
MPWYITLIVGLALMMGLIFTGVPIFVAFLIINAVGILWAFGPAAFGMYSNSLLSTLTNEPLVTVPLFLLMGELLFRSGAIDRLYGALDKLIGNTRIRLYMLGIALATALGTLSGSAMADAAMLGRTLYPGMVGRGYDRKLSAGLIMSGATLAPIIPPSVLAVVLGSLAEVSIAELLIAGIGPGLLIAGLLLLYVRIRVWIDPSKAPPLDPDFKPASVRERVTAIFELVPFLGVIFMVIGFILLGIASPTESAATGVVATLFVAAYHRRLTVRLVRDALFAAARTTGTIMIIVMSATLFGQLLSFTGAPEALIRTVEHVGLDRWTVYFAMMAVAFVSCMFVGVYEFMLISVPIYAPLIAALHFDPIWFWMIYLVNVTTGGMTPPFGLTMFVFKSVVPDMSIIDIYNATWPYVAVIVMGLLVMTFAPGIVMFLPRLMY